MKRQLRSLRVRLAVTGFVAIYIPALVLGSVLFLTEDITVISDAGETVLEQRRSGLPVLEATDVNVPVGLAQVETGRTVSGSAVLSVVLLAPLAAGLAWWWSGRAVRPVREAVVLQERLIEEASHELRSPLTVLATNAEVLLAHPEPTLDLYRRGLERSGAVAERMAAAVQSLLVDARGRARTIERQPTDLAELARSVADALAPVAADQGVTLRVTGPRPVPARVDRPSVERALTNLVINAVEHAPDGSPVELRVATTDGQAEITVTDQGPGIPPGEQGRIFERYWQAEPDTDGPGSGLGLAIVRQIAAAHGGSVTVRSPISGTTGTELRLLLTR